MLPREIENTIVEKLDKFFNKKKKLLIQLENLDNPDDISTALKFDSDLNEYILEIIEVARKRTYKKILKNAHIQQRINKSSFKGWIKFHFKKFIYEHTQWYVFENEDIDLYQSFDTETDIQNLVCEIIETNLYWKKNK